MLVVDRQPPSAVDSPLPGGEFVAVSQRYERAVAGRPIQRDITILERGGRTGDGRPEHEWFAVRITVPGNAPFHERNQSRQHPITMKRPSLTDKFGESESSGDDQVTDAIAEALSANDKVVEIRPAKQSSGMGLKRLLLLGAGAIGLAAWARRSQKPDELIGRVKEKTADRTGRAAETIEEGTRTASERIEAGSERARNAVQEAGETVADRTEEAGEQAADETDSGSSSSSRS